ncbi:hypothetical protein D3C84_1043540 [compost metagenome]
MVHDRLDLLNADFTPYLAGILSSRFSREQAASIAFCRRDTPEDGLGQTAQLIDFHQLYISRHRTQRGCDDRELRIRISIGRSATQQLPQRLDHLLRPVAQCLEGLRGDGQRGQPAAFLMSQPL